MDHSRQLRCLVAAATIGLLGAVICSFVLAASTRASAEPQIFTMAPGMHARATAIGPDGNLWFAATSSANSRGPGAVGRVDSDGKVIEFALAEKGGAAAIVSGPDGNLWFSEPGADRVGRVTVDGTITTFPLPGSGSRPGGIATGADGNLWFTEFGVGKIGRVTPAGSITEFALGPQSKPAGIVAGPDGNLWFTEHGANRIGRITPSGQIAEFPLRGIADPRPTAITAGPDGNLWFTLERGYRIGRVTPAGMVALFPVPGSIGALTITAGPDGNLWFGSSGAVGALAPDGRPAGLSCLKSNCRLPVLSLTAGADGEMWAGTGIEYPRYGGGGTYITVTLNQPGYIARFPPRSTTTELTSEARPVRHRRTRLRLRCGHGGGCHGVLRLTRRRESVPGRNAGEVPVGRALRPRRRRARERPRRRQPQSREAAGQRSLHRLGACRSRRR